MTFRPVDFLRRILYAIAIVRLLWARSLCPRGYAIWHTDNVVAQERLIALFRNAVNNLGKRDARLHGGAFSRKIVTREHLAQMRGWADMLVEHMQTVRAFPSFRSYDSRRAAMESRAKIADQRAADVAAKAATA